MIKHKVPPTESATTAAFTSEGPVRAASRKHRNDDHDEDRSCVDCGSQSSLRLALLRWTVVKVCVG